jgi:hypothetical protein
MGSVKCKVCDRDIGTYEKKCPVCGATANKRPAVYYLYAFAAIVLVLAISTQVYDLLNEKKRKMKNKCKLHKLHKLHLQPI